MHRARPIPGRCAGVRPETSIRIRIEIALVLLLSLGASAVWSLLQFIDVSTRDAPIGEQTVALNPSRNDRPWLDLAYQFVSLTLDFVPVVLVFWLLWRRSSPHLGALGIYFTRPARDAAWAVGLALLVGVPGLAIFVGGRAAGLTAAIEPSPLDAEWFTVPILVLSAFRSGLTEQVIVIGYLFERLQRLGWSPWAIIISTSLLRATYHLYQGIPALIGNFAMGLLFGWLYQRTGRLVPLIIAHTLIDIAVFVGYPWAYAAFPEVFGAGASEG